MSQPLKLRSDYGQTAARPGPHWNPWPAKTSSLAAVVEHFETLIKNDGDLFYQMYPDTDERFFITFQQLTRALKKKDQAAAKIYWQALSNSSSAAKSLVQDNTLISFVMDGQTSSGYASRVAAADLEYWEDKSILGVLRIIKTYGPDADYSFLQRNMLKYVSMPREIIKALQKEGLIQPLRGDSSYPITNFQITPLGLSKLREGRVFGDASISELAQRVARRFMAQESDPLHGSSKQKVLKIVSKLMEPFTKGLFRDEYWKPVADIRETFGQEHIPFIMLKSEYQHEKGIPVRKVWLFEIPFTNNKMKPDKVYVHITAAGAGSVQSPLDLYDITAYAT